MGSPSDEHARGDDEPLHRVSLTQGYWIAETACTQALWQAVMGFNPSEFEGEQRPVETVSWTAVQGFVTRLDKTLAGVGRSGPRFRLRLPREAEWECACRAGTGTPFSFGEDIGPEQVNYDGIYPYRGSEKGLYREKTVEVASLEPNAWGLFEMHGNVWEWCHDWYGKYPPGPVSDPAGPPDDVKRVLRGGAWFSNACSARSALRRSYPPGFRLGYLGFRLALGPELRQEGAGTARGER